MSKPARERKITIYSRPPELDMILEDGPPKEEYNDSKSKDPPPTASDSGADIPEFDHDESNNYNNQNIAPWRNYSNVAMKQRMEDSLSQLKLCTTKLNLPTRRPSYVAWRNQHLRTLEEPTGVSEKVTHRKGDALCQSPGLNLNLDLSRGIDTGLNETDWEQTPNTDSCQEDRDAESSSSGDTERNIDEYIDLVKRKHSINGAISMIREELESMRGFDQALANTLMTLRRELHQVKISRFSHAHRELLDEAIFNVERDELDEICDLPPRLFSPDLKHYGVTKMNVQARRFSVF